MCIRDRAEIERVQEMGGAVAAVESGYMKQAMVGSHADRRAKIEAGEMLVIGVNCFLETEESPLTKDLDTAIQAPDPEAESSAIAEVKACLLYTSPSPRDS